MNKKEQEQLAKLQKDDDFLYLYGEYKKQLSVADWDRIKVLEISISDYVKKKHKKVFQFFKSYEYRAIWRYLIKENFILLYHAIEQTKRESEQDLKDSDLKDEVIH